MKLLRNRWVTGLLSLGAIIVVFFQVFQGRSQRASTGSETASTVPRPPNPEVKPLALLDTQPPKTAESAERAIDESYPQTRLKQWLDAPRRDPFFLEGPGVAQNVNDQAPSAVLQWKLNGIWRQTGGRVAAINHHVYAEGDTISEGKPVQRYTILRIEGDQVWFEGPQGKERLGFEKPQSKALTSPDPN
jgi:hypothetical protein